MARRWSGVLGLLAGCLVGVAPGWTASVPLQMEPMPWVIESAEYAGELKEQIVRMEARYTIRVIRDGWIEIPLGINGATITDIKIEKKSGEAHVMPRGGRYVLAASRSGTYKVLVKCSHLIVQDSQFEGVHLGIPQATFSTLTLIVPRKEVELRASDALYVESQPDVQRAGVKLTARLGASDQVDLRWRTKPAAPVKIEPVLYGEVQIGVTIEEQLARFTSIIGYRIAQGETRELLVRLPAGMNVLNVRGAGIDDWRVTEGPDDKTLRVALGFPLKDAAYQLIVEGEETIEGQSETYTLPEIRLEGVKQERGHVAVSRSGSIELSPQAVEGINRVDVKELPDALRVGAGSSVMLAFRYHQHPYRATLALTRHEDHPVLSAIAEQAELVTVLSQQGELLTRATYLIKANKKQFVEVLLPEGATLWSCLVSGKSVKPAQGTGKMLLVPLDAMADVTQTVPLELVYFEQRSALVRVGQVTLQGPVLDVPTTVANWFLYAPNDIKFLKMSGNLERGAAAFDFVAEPFGSTIALAAELPAALGVPRSGSAVDELYLKQAATSAPLQAVSERDREEQTSYQPYYGQSEYRVNEKNSEGVMDQVAARVNQMLGRSDDYGPAEVANSFTAPLQETGILPLKIRLPKSGTVYRFNRLMTAQEPLTVRGTFVHLRVPVASLAAVGLLLLLLVGRFAIARLPRAES